MGEGERRSVVVGGGQVLIEIRDLSRTFEEGGRERVVLAGANATLFRGEIAVLVGRSGSGKSRKSSCNVTANAWLVLS